MDFKITKREVLASIAIICVMLLFGLMISASISDHIMDKNQEYTTALQINADEDMFRYGMKTNIGNSLVYGELKAVDPVTYSEIGGKYSYIEKAKEKYTMHTRTVTYTDSKGKAQTKTETYWSWDRVSSESKHCKKIIFLNVQFNYGKINFPSPNYITTINESSNIRYKYYGADTKYTGTLYAKLNDNTINDSKFYNNKNIDETLERLTSGAGLIVFWVFWVLLIIAIVFGFCYIDNHWLEDKKCVRRFANENY